MAVPVQTDLGFGTPSVLFERSHPSAPGRNYDVAPDGRFLMTTVVGETAEDSRRPEITVVRNWFDERVGGG